MRDYEHRSVKAVWSYRIAILGVLAFAGTFVWHRFFGLPTPLAMKMFGAATAAAAIGLALGVAALVNIWNEGSIGAGRASFAVFLSSALLAIPLWSLPNLLTLPRLYDVTTDPESPPAFDRIATIRQGQANPAHYESTFRPLQAAAYPDIKPLIVARPLADAFSAALETVKALNWKVVGEHAPEAAKSGYREAVDRTWIFGFADDVAIRITGSQRAAKIDIRSSSRFGPHDLGRNARRIRHFQEEVKRRLAEIERAERMERVIASREAARKAAENMRRHRRGGRGQDEESGD